jgi:ABC-type transport system involved in multi-copper enzyme maturation permease subunit
VIGRITAIALNTFREAIRRRMLYVIVILVVGFNLFAMVLGAMSLGEEARVARDVSLAGISVGGSITAIVLGVILLYGEVQRRTIHTIIAKPIARFEFVLGKYAGMAVTLLALVLLFTLALTGLLWLQNVAFTMAVVKAILLSYCEILVVAAIALLFSSFSTPYLSGLFTFGLFVLGRVTPEMRAVVESGKMGALEDISRAALVVVPDLHLFAVSGGAVGGKYVSVHGEFVSWGYVAQAAGYGLLYVVILLVVSSVIFSRRDFV